MGTASPAYLEIQRQKPPTRPIAQRLRDWREVPLPYDGPRCRIRRRAAWTAASRSAIRGCPLGNLIPDWNDLVYRDRWRRRSIGCTRRTTFPEFTGRLCPAPCEDRACSASTTPPVTIKAAEAAIIERAFDEGLDRRAQPPAYANRQARRRRRLGTGGLAAADQLNRAGHAVTGVRARRSHRRPAPLRHSGVQAREALARAPPGADARRGRHHLPDRLPHRRQRGSAAS